MSSEAPQSFRDLDKFQQIVVCAGGVLCAAISDVASRAGMMYDPEMVPDLSAYMSRWRALANCPIRYSQVSKEVRAMLATQGISAVRMIPFEQEDGSHQALEMLLSSEMYFLIPAGAEYAKAWKEQVEEMRQGVLEDVNLDLDALEEELRAQAGFDAFSADEEIGDDSDDEEAETPDEGGEGDGSGEPT